MCPTWRCSIPQRKRPTASGIKGAEDGRKVRFFKSNGAVVEA